MDRQVVTLETWTKSESVGTSMSSSLIASSEFVRVKESRAFLGLFMLPTGEYTFRRRTLNLVAARRALCKGMLRDQATNLSLTDESTH
jgi:hypothetical protein